MRLSSSEVELYVALSELRFLTTDQIHRGWYPDRPATTVTRRLRAMRQADWLESHRLGGDCPGLVWRLTRTGIRILQGFRETDGPGYTPRFSVYYLPHLLATNEIFLTLAGSCGAGGVEWTGLAFRWWASHRARFPFEVVKKGRVGRRRRELRPDALIEPRGGGPRVFLELDRSTECISPKANRRSIVGKLQAYRSFINLSAPGSRDSAYKTAFRDGRPPRLVFVLTKVDQRSLKAGHRDRRLRAILAAARDVVPELDVRCLYADNQVGVCDALAVAATASIPAADKPKVELTETSMVKLADFYRLATGALKGVPLEQRQRVELVDAARKARSILQQVPAQGEPK